MAGHSKWANIKHRKGAQDAARGKIFQKLFKEIYVAATLPAGADPDTNPSLKLAISKAKSKNMPKANIERALAKAKGESKEGSSFVETLFNATITGGATFLIKTLSDNMNRTKSQMTMYFNRQNAILGKTGQIPFQFDHKGILEISKNNIDEENLTLVALDNGAEDIEITEESYVITTLPENFTQCKIALEDALNISDFLQCEVTYLPNSTVSFDAEKTQKLSEFIDLLEDDDDVQEVFHNIELNIE
ncbi:YebC/PmpR family DNA-binding transcriptional regulator [Mycoplasma sp. 1018B]|uniref:YebC/PmpR family DNA-binding transcriptional regulator n=1 Tax=Mycoplasma sp. 1018B TaxID=2967302 RepID=UPI00211C011D|nr:YebC/PmpR family DNA-binding transcriptional regulator [Mycoplasma sp. 1018B]UUM19345.1 YebC/PmpR family DNA-binding transcriptional regulator [Mycoplasma sp. 1018B]